MSDSRQDAPGHQFCLVVPCQVARRLKKMEKDDQLYLPPPLRSSEGFPCVVWCGLIFFLLFFIPHKVNRVNFESCACHPLGALTQIWPPSARANQIETPLGPLTSSDIRSILYLLPGVARGTQYSTCLCMLQRQFTAHYLFCFCFLLFYRFLYFSTYERKTYLFYLVRFAWFLRWTTN